MPTYLCCYFSIFDKSCKYVLVAIAEGEEDWCAAKIEGVTKAALEIALIAPVKEAEVTTIDDEPWWAGVGLDHVA